MLAAARDTTAADWLKPRWSKKFTGQLVPLGFEACARIFHPASFDGRQVTWAEIAAAYGKVAHARMGWDHLVPKEVGFYGSAPGVFDSAPEFESLPRELVGVVTAVLADHTHETDRCWFGFWHGYGRGPESPEKGAPEFDVPARGYHLFSGHLEDAVGFTDGPIRGDHIGPSVWWPDDRVWFVASDTDLNTTFVGGSRALVEDLVASSDLEAYEVPPETDFDHRWDDINPGGW